MVYGVLKGLVAACCLVYAYALGPVGAVLVWPAVAFGSVSAAYFGVGPRIFGKRPDGSRSPAARLLLLPYTGLLVPVWHLWRLADRQPSHHELVPGVLIGRRLLPDEYPEPVGTILDLTCEFRATTPGNGVIYRSLPVLDGNVPREEDLRAMLDSLASLPAPVYIHCANGHGRTGLFAAALLLRRGEAKDPDHAVRAARERRPRIRLNRTQRRALDRLAATG
jgi:hypothetical protein